MTSVRVTLPWNDTDILRMCITSAVGVIAIAVSWYGISGSAVTGTQALWLNIGVAGAVISACGNGVWLLRGRRAVGERRAELVSLQLPEASHMVDVVQAPATTSTTSLGLVRAVGMSRVHRPDCPLIAGKQVEQSRLGEGDPCGVCVP